MTGLQGPEVSTRFITADDDAHDAAVRLRHRVFYAAQGIGVDEVPDSREARSMHLVAEAGGEVVGYGRLTPEGTRARISQMVVDPAWRRRGVGTLLLWRLVDAAERRGEPVGLSAKLGAVAFYRRLGFVAVGKPYPSERLVIPVQDMELEATACRPTSAST